KGEHVLRMTANIGDIADVISTVQQCSRDLTRLYSKIVIITGPEPDRFRDYNLHKKIPGLIETLEKNAAVLRSQVQYIREKFGSGISEAMILDRIAFQLETMIKEPNSISRRLADFKNNISTLSSWVLSIS